MPDEAVADPSRAVGATGAAGVAGGVGGVVSPKVLAALGRFRIAAMVVGVALIVLVVAMVLRYGFDQRWAVATWGPIHGVLYFGYFLLALDLSFKARWTPIGTLLVILAGVVPIGSFYAERAVRAKTLAGQRV